MRGDDAFRPNVKLAASLHPTWVGRLVSPTHDVGQGRLHTQTSRNSSSRCGQTSSAAHRSSRLQGHLPSPVRCKNNLPTNGPMPRRERHRSVVSGTVGLGGDSRRPRVTCMHRLHRQDRLAIGLTSSSIPTASLARWRQYEATSVLGATRDRHSKNPQSTTIAFPAEAAMPSPRKSGFLSGYLIGCHCSPSSETWRSTT